MASLSFGKPRLFLEENLGVVAVSACLTWGAGGGGMSSLQADVRDFTANNGVGTALTNYRIYTPPAAETARIRGVILVLPGSGDDFRYFANDAMFQTAARSLGFAVVACTNENLYWNMTQSQAQTGLNNILTAAANVTGHSELVNAPIISTGYSAGAIISTSLACQVPDRLISIVAHKGAHAYQADNPTATGYVQSLWIPGSADPNGVTKPSAIMNYFDDYRGTSNPDGQAAFAVDWRTGHSTNQNQGWSMAWSWMAETIAMRYPQNTVPSTVAGNPVVLLNEALEDGWLGTRSYVTSTDGSDHSSFVTISPYASYTGDKANASWLPNETLARAYQAFTSFDDNYSRTDVPLQGPLKIGGDVSPTAWSLSSKTTGSTVNVQVDPRVFDDTNPIVRMEYYDGSTLMGVQTAPNGSGQWVMPLTLATKGIHTLTVVATNSLGKQTSALQTVVVTQAKETGKSHWRFEQNPGLITDQHDNNVLSQQSDVSHRPVLVDKPASGAGSHFRDLTGEYGENRSALKFDGTNGAYQYLTTYDNEMYTNGVNSRFTFEAMVNMASSAASTRVRGIASHGGYSGTQMGWVLGVTADDSAYGARNLTLEFTQDGAANHRETIDSDLQLQPGVDYYVAVAFDPGDTSDAGATFYLMDLTNNGPLLKVQKSHVMNSMWNSSFSMYLGAGNLYNPWDGLLDEMRFSSSLLSVSELLISQTIPEPCSLLVLAMTSGLSLTMARRRSGRREM